MTLTKCVCTYLKIMCLVRLIVSVSVDDNQNGKCLTLLDGPRINIEKCGRGFLMTIPDEESIFKGIDFFGNVNKPLDPNNDGNASIRGNFVLRPGKNWRFAAKQLMLKNGDTVYYGVTLKTYVGIEHTQRNLKFTLIGNDEDDIRNIRKSPSR